MQLTTAVSHLDPTMVLPEEISLMIFSHLTKPTLAVCCLVNKCWKKLASDNQPWEKIAKQMFNGDIPRAPSIKTFLQLIEPQIVRSNEALVDRTQAFVNKLSLGKNGRFSCMTVGKNYQTISLEIKGTIEPIIPIQNVRETESEPIHFHVKEDCIAIHDIGIRMLTRAILDPSTKKFLTGVRMDQMTFTVPENGPFKATLRSSFISADLEDKFIIIAKKKLFQIYDQVPL